MRPSVDRRTFLKTTAAAAGASWAGLGGLPLGAAEKAKCSTPSAENLLLLTLCFVFFGAGGIGVLGLTSLGLYMRARSDRARRSPPPRYIGRRRY